MMRGGSGKRAAGYDFPIDEADLDDAEMSDLGSAKGKKAGKKASGYGPEIKEEDLNEEDLQDAEESDYPKSSSTDDDDDDDNDEGFEIGVTYKCNKSTKKNQPCRRTFKGNGEN
ncbi:uncharacterized protein PAC_01649 [Phialocephala subalpina]|uniref:Uncharacterized protein n=1 Tax=Phialocephala subalpina TaxID=576137 RepID=A0A1L7WG69_9HELO|nr:uncharacterized protein PAC_01649 [Phialocephala subalpina]